MYGSYTENPEYVYVQTDNEDKILFGVKTDGEFFFGAGCPQQVKDYIEDKISSLSLDEYEDMVAFLSDYLGSDTTLKVMIDSINERIPELIDNPEFIEVKTDAEDKVLYGVKDDGDFYFGAGVPGQVQEEIKAETKRAEAVEATKLDKEGLDSNALGTVQTVENPEWVSVTTDSEDKILGGRKRDGTVVENKIAVGEVSADTINIDKSINCSEDAKRILQTTVNEHPSPAYYYQKGAAPKSFTKIPCILVAGQSNGDGRAPLADLPQEMRSASPYTKCLMDVYGWGNNFRQVDVNHYFSDLWGYDLPVYYYFSGLNQKDLYVIKHAIGGSSIDANVTQTTNHWSADYEKVLAKGDTSCLLNLNNFFRTLSDLNRNVFEVRALLWHQGEGDYRFNVSKKYYQNFGDMVAFIRGMVGNANLPVIYGTISHLSAGYSKEVEDAQLKFAQDDENAYAIDMSGAPLLDESPNPPLHFNADSNVYLGQMVFNTLIDLGIIEANKITPIKPW
jgi:hypothetical protein